MDREIDPAFESLLLEGGVGEDVVKVLKEQKVVSLRIFRAMKEDHSKTAPVQWYACWWPCSVVGVVGEGPQPRSFFTCSS